MVKGKAGPPPISGKKTAAKKTAAKFSKPSGELPPPKIVLMGVEGWGKTTAAAYAKKVALIMAQGETGYLTLQGGQRVPSIDCLETARWKDTLAAIDTAISGDYDTIALDEQATIGRVGARLAIPVLALDFVLAGTAARLVGHEDRCVHPDHGRPVEVVDHPRHDLVVGHSEPLVHDPAVAVDGAEPAEIAVGPGQVDAEVRCRGHGLKLPLRQPATQSDGTR